MKKTILGFISGAVAMLLALTIISPAFAANAAQTISATLNGINISVNGEKVASEGENYILPNGNSTAYSILYNGTTYVALRQIGEILNLDINYDNNTQTASLNEKSSDTESETTTDTTVEDSIDVGTVMVSDDLTYDEFKDLWEIGYTSNNYYFLNLKDTINTESAISCFEKLNNGTLESYTYQLFDEYYSINSGIQDIRFYKDTNYAPRLFVVGITHRANGGNEKYFYYG